MGRPRLLAFIAGGVAFSPRQLRTEVLSHPAEPHSTLACAAPEHFGVATQHPLATGAAVAILSQGGNAADAAVAAAFTLGVVAPDCSGLGGGGFALVADALARDFRILDFRETAPGRLDARALERQLDEPDPRRKGQLVGVPGEVRGLFELHRRYGRLPIETDMTPAIRAAESGYDVAGSLARNAYAYRSEIDATPMLRMLFDPPAIGPAFIGFHIPPENALARTLRTLAREGPDAFYRGPIGEDIVKSVAAAGGWLSAGDLATYAVVEREPLRISWEGYDVLTMPPPSAGGLLLAETLKSTSRAHLRALGFNSPDYIHELAEVFRSALGDRMRSIGDPAYAGANVAALTDDKHMLRRKAIVDSTTTHALPSARVEEHGTSHLVVVDSTGTVVSLTTTIGDAFGARVVGEQSGVVLNDELIDFSSARQFRPFRARVAGRRELSSPNAPHAGARPVSSMMPTIVLHDGVPVLALGGAGGLRIATGVAQALLGRLAFDQTPADAVRSTRFHTPYDGPTIELEFGMGEPAATELRERGEHVEWFNNFSAVQMVAIQMHHDVLERVVPAADPRFAGSAEGH